MIQMDLSFTLLSESFFSATHPPIPLLHSRPKRWKLYFVELVLSYYNLSINV